MADAPVLVLGATGGFGGAVVFELLARGRRVRALVRGLEKAGKRFGGAAGLDLVAGDAEDSEALTKAAAGSSAIVHAVNPRYDQWLPKLEDATANVIAAAKTSGAAILFPGNIYGLGLQTDAPLDETVENKPNTERGELRVRLEDSLRAASGEGVQVIILRAGDFFGPTVRNGLADPLFGRALVGRTMRTLGRVRIPRQWAYAPDLARATIDLLDKRAGLAPFEIVHDAGYVVPEQRAFAARIAEAVDYKGLGLRPFPWWVLGLLSKIDPILREVVKMRYLFENSVILDGARFSQVLPGFARTPLEDAIEATLASYKADWEEKHGKPLTHRYARERAAAAARDSAEARPEQPSSEPAAEDAASSDREAARRPAGYPARPRGRGHP